MTCPTVERHREVPIAAKAPFSSKTLPLVNREAAVHGTDEGAQQRQQRVGAEAPAFSDHILHPALGDTLESGVGSASSGCKDGRAIFKNARVETRGAWLF